MIYPFGQIMGDKERGRLFSIQMDGSESVPFIIKKDKLLIGRGDSCEIRIYVDGVSPEHCVISFNDEGRGFVEPITKSCLTLLNGELIERQVSLEHNDVITIVKRSFRFFYPSSSKFYVAIQPVTNPEEITVEDHLDFDPEEAFTKRSRELQEKRVTFGPRLSPEEFDRNMPPASPLRRGSLPADKLKAKTPDTQKSHFKRALFNNLARDNPGTSVEELSRLKVLQSTSVVLHKLRCSGSVEIQNVTDQSEKNTTNSRPLFSEVLKKSTKDPRKNVAANKTTLQRYSPKRLAKKALKNSKKTFYKSPGKPVHPRVLAVGSTGHANSPETIVIYKKRMTPARKNVSSAKKRKSLRLGRGSLNSRNSRKSISEKSVGDNTENRRSTPARESMSTQHNNSLDIFDTVTTPEISHTSLNEVYDNPTPRRKSVRPQNKRDSTPSQEKDTNDKHLSTSPLAVAIDSVAQLDENSIDKSLKDIHNAVQALACHSGVSSALNNEPSSSDMCLNAVKKLALTISMVNAFHMYRRIIDDVSGFPLCFPSTSFDSNRDNMRCVQRSGAHSNEEPVDIGRMFQDVMRNFFTSSVCNDIYDGGRKGMLRSCTNDLCPEVASICNEESRKSRYAAKNKVALRVIDSACKNPKCKSVHSHHEDIGVFYESDEMEKENDTVFMNESGFCSNCTPVKSSCCENSGRESMSGSDTFLNSTEATSRSSLSQMKEYSRRSNDPQTSGNRRLSTPKGTNLRKTRKSITLNSSSKKVAKLNQSKRRLSLQPKKSPRVSLKGSRVSSKSAENSPATIANSAVKLKSLRKSVAAESKSLKSAENSPALTMNSSVKLKSLRKSVAAESKSLKSVENSPVMIMNSSVKLKSPRKSVAAESKTSKSAENSPSLIINSSAKLKPLRKSVSAELKTLKSVENSPSLIINSSVKLKSLRKSVAAESKPYKVSLVAKRRGITASKKIKEQKANQKHRLSVLKKVNYKVKSPEIGKALKQNLKSPRLLLQKDKENTQLKSKKIRVSQKLLQKAKSRASTSPTVSPGTKIVLSPKVLRKRIEKRKSVVFKGLGSRSKRSDLTRNRKRKSSVANISPKQLPRNDKTRKLKKTSENDEMDIDEDKESEPAAKLRSTEMDSEIEAKITATKKQKESTPVVKSRKVKGKKATKSSNARKQRSSKTADNNENEDVDFLANEKVDNKHTGKDVSLSKINKSKKDFVRVSLTPIKETRNLRKRECVKMSRAQNEDKNSAVSQKAVEVSINHKKDMVLKIQTAEMTPQKSSKARNRKGRKIENSPEKNDDKDSLEKPSQSKQKFEIEKEQISEKAATPKKAVRSNRRKKVSKLSPGNESNDLAGEVEEIGQKAKNTVLKEITKNATARSLRSKQSKGEETSSTDSVEDVVKKSQKPDRRRKEYRDQKKLAGVEEKPETVDNENQSQRTTRKRKNANEDKNEISPRKAVESSKSMGRKRRNQAALLDATNEEDPVEVIATKEGTTVNDSQNKRRKGRTDENVPEGTPKRGVEISKSMGRKRRNQAALLDATNEKGPVEVMATKEGTALNDSQNKKRKGRTGDENVPEGTPKRGKRKRNPDENTKDIVNQTAVSSRTLRSRK